jgi:hypothetical protein
MRPHRILICAATAGALALAPSAPALAAGHTHHGAAHAHGSTHGQRQGTGHGRAHASGHGNAHGKNQSTRDRLAGPRGAAGHVVRAQAARLARMLDTIASGDTLNADDQAALLAALQADLDALTTDVGAIAEATSVHELNAIKHAAVLTVTIAARQTSVTAGADAAEAQAAQRAATVTDLLVQIAIAADMGQPVAGAQAALDDAQTQLTTATSDAQDAIDDLLAVSPTASRSELNNACDAAAQALLDAQDALASADADIATANAALG